MKKKALDEEKIRKVDETLAAVNNYFSKELLAAGTLSIGDQIQLIRSRLGMSQAQLAKRAGLQQAHIAWIEQEKKDPGIKTVKKIFQALGCDLLVLPKAKKPLDKIVTERAKIAAEKRYEWVNNKDNYKPLDLIRADEEKFCKYPSSVLWEDQEN